MLARRDPDPVRLGQLEVVARLEAADRAAFNSLDGHAQVVDPHLGHGGSLASRATRLADDPATRSGGSSDERVLPRRQAMVRVALSDPPTRTSISSLQPRRADARIRTADPFITREVRGRERRVTASFSGHVSAAKRGYHPCRSSRIGTARGRPSVPSWYPPRPATGSPHVAIARRPRACDRNLLLAGPPRPPLRHGRQAGVLRASGVEAGCGLFTPFSTSSANARRSGIVRDSSEERRVAGALACEHAPVRVHDHAASCTGRPRCYAAPPGRVNVGSNSSEPRQRYSVSASPSARSSAGVRGSGQSSAS